MLKDFYVYTLFRENGVPFYLGKGRLKRCYAHEREARNGARGHKAAIIRGMLARGLQVPIVKIHEDLTEVVAHTYEAVLIKAIGRGKNGPLVNLSDGGEGASGRPMSQETRAKIAAAGRGRSPSPETRAKLRAKKMTMEAKIRIAAALRGRTKTAEHVAKVAAALRGYKHSPLARLNNAVAQRGRRHSLETRAKMSEAKRGRKPSPESIAKRSAARRGRKLGKQSPEHIAKRAASLRGQKYSPERSMKAWATRRRNQEKSDAG